MRSYMKITLLLFFTLFLLVQVSFAITLEKNITGNNLLELNEEIQVSIKINSESTILLDRLEEDIPQGFNPVNLPNSCETTTGKIICSFGFSTNQILLTYSLRAIENSVALMKTAKVFYGNNEVQVSNRVNKTYYIGPPKVNITKRALIADGVELKEHFAALPKSELSLNFQIKNTGVIYAKDISIYVQTPSSWSSIEPLALPSLNSDQTKSINFSLEPPENYTGTAFIRVNITWDDEFSARSDIDYFTDMEYEVTITRPNVDVKRSTSLEWRKIEEKTEPIPIIIINYEVKNLEKINTLIKIQQDLPFNLYQVKVIPDDLDYTRTNQVIDFNINSEDIETIKFQIEGTTDSQNVTVGTGKAVYFDRGGRKYEEFIFEPKDIIIKKGLIALLYKLMAPLKSTLEISSVLIFFAGLFLIWKLKNRPKLVTPLSIIVIIAFIIMFVTASIEGESWIFYRYYLILKGILGFLISLLGV